LTTPPPPPPPSHLCRGVPFSPHVSVSSPRKLFPVPPSKLRTFFPINTKPVPFFPTPSSTFLFVLWRRAPRDVVILFCLSPDSTFFLRAFFFRQFAFFFACVVDFFSAFFLFYFFSGKATFRSLAPPPAKQRAPRAPLLCWCFFSVT